MALFDLTWSIQVNKMLPPILRDREIIELDGEFKTGSPDTDYTLFILASSPGHWKETPDLGVNLGSYLLGNDSPQVIRRAIKLHLESDVFKNPIIDISEFPIVKVNSIIFELQQ